MSNTTIDAQQTDEGDALLFLAGEVDLSHADTLWNTALRALDAEPRRLVADLSAVTFLDSAILGVLIRIHRAAGERGRDFVLQQPSPLVQRLLRITGLESVIRVEP